MHELGIMTGVISSVVAAAEDARARQVTDITLRIGRMTEVIEDALQFAFEALAPNTICEGASLHIIMVEPRSTCLECGLEYEHNRFQMVCPACGSFATQLLAGREMSIDSIEVETDS